MADRVAGTYCYPRRPMDKPIGFDVNNKHTFGCVPQAGRADYCTGLPTDTGRLRALVQTQRGPGDRLSLTFEVCGLVRHRHDGLVDVIEYIAVIQSSKRT